MPLRVAATMRALRENQSKIDLLNRIFGTFIA